MLLKDAVKVAINVTKIYEGGGVTWDFDGAGLSLGLLQWNLGSGTLQPMLNKFLNLEVGVKTFGVGRYSELSNMLAVPKEEQMAWAKQINDYTKRAVKEPWLSELKAMIATDEWKQIEMGAAKPYLDTARAETKWSGVPTLRSFCMFFDIAVQCGSMGAALKLALSAAKPFLLAASKDGKFKKTDNDKAWLIACAGSRALVSYMSTPQFALGVFKRKLGIVEGGFNWRKGELPQVNSDVNFEAANYGVSDEVIEDL